MPNRSCKFDSAVAAKILDVLKHAATEEGQWGEKRDQGANGSEIVPVRVNVMFVAPPERQDLPKGHRRSSWRDKVDD